MTEKNDSILELRSITKKFPGVVALNSVDFTLYPGEVHALVGENGAGKSTLVNILSGVFQPDSGEMFLYSKKTIFYDEKDSIRNGIGTVFQERSLTGKMSVADNIYAARQPVNRLGFIRDKELIRNASIVLKRLKLNIDPKALVGELSSAKQQQIEIAKALSLKANILILDEATATITESEAKILFNLIRDLKKEEIAIIYISHRLEEIFEIADRVTVLKDGKVVSNRSVSETNVNELIKMMTGKEIGYDIIRKDKRYPADTPVLEVRNISKRGVFQNVSFKLFEGEVLGFAGLVGAGKTEIVQSLFSVVGKDSGEIFLSGKKVNIKTPADAIKLGIGFMPEDKKEQGLFLSMTVEDNIISSNLSSCSKFGWLNQSDITNIALNYIDKLQIKTPGPKQKVMNLSGGNQQKIVLAKWLGLKKKILIVDEPTRGIDVGTKAEIYNLLYQLVEAGTSIIIISSEFKELINFCNRIIVLWEGKIVGELSPEEATEEVLFHLASGLVGNHIRMEELN